MDERAFRRAALARELMRPAGFVLHEGDDAWSAARRLFESGQTGAPVLGGDERLVGVISQSDLAAYWRESSRRAPDFYAESERDPIPALPAASVGQLMSRVIISVPEDMPLDEIERHMLRRRVQRVLVVREGRVLGVVTAADLLGAR